MPRTNAKQIKFLSSALNRFSKNPIIARRQGLLIISESFSRVLEKLFHILIHEAKGRNHREKKSRLKVQFALFVQTVYHRHLVSFEMPENLGPNWWVPPSEISKLLSHASGQSLVQSRDQTILREDQRKSHVKANDSIVVFFTSGRTKRLTKHSKLSSAQVTTRKF